MDNKIGIYSRIDENIRNLAQEFVHQCKINGIKETDTRNKLIEVAIQKYISLNQIAK